MKGYGQSRRREGGYGEAPVRTPKRKHESRTIDPKRKKIDKKRARREAKESLE